MHRAADGGDKKTKKMRICGAEEEGRKEERHHVHVVFGWFFSARNPIPLSHFFILFLRLYEQATTFLRGGKRSRRVSNGSWEK